jgi:Tfp pilus assembly protein PilO
MAKNKEAKVKKTKEKRSKEKKPKAKITQKTFVNVVAIGVCALIVIYVFIYRDYASRTEEIKSSNKELQNTIDELQTYADNIDQYKSAIEDMQNQIDESLSVYPADAREEDIVMLAVNIQEDNDVTYSSIGMEEAEVVYEIPDSLVTSLGMEGYDDSIKFTKKSANYVNDLDYGNLKSVIEQIFDSPNRIGIDSISYSKNDEEAILEGSIALYFYSASGTGKEYEAPDIAAYTAGTSDMFKTGSAYRSNEESGLEDEEENGEAQSEQKAE